MVCASRGVDILDTSLDTGSTSADGESVVVDSSNDSNSVLGGTLYACGRPTSRPDIWTKETSLEIKEKQEKC